MGGSLAPTPPSRALSLGKTPMAYALQACIEPAGIRTIKSMLMCLDRFGKELFLEANDHQVAAAPAAAAPL